MTRRATRSRPRAPRRPGGRPSAAVAAVVVVLLAGCEDEPGPDGAAPEEPPPGRDEPGPAEPGQDEPGGRVGPAPVGVSPEPCPSAIDEERGCIHLGSLVDRSDPESSAEADQQLEGQRDFWERVNEAGGVADHEIHLADHVRDVTEDGGEQVAGLEDVVDDVLAFALLPGDATSEQLAGELVDRRLTGVVPGWWSGWHADAYRRSLLLPADHSRCQGVTIGLDWYAEEVERPQAVLGIAPDGRRADDVAAAGELWAEVVGARWLGVTEAGAGDRDDGQDAAVQAVLEQSPDVVVLATRPAATGELVRKAAARGFQGTFLGLVDSWEPDLLDPPEQGQALQALYRHVGPWGGEGAHAAMLEARGDGPVPPGYRVGWLSSYPLLAALRAAAASDELTRDGLRDALAGLEIDEGGPPRRELGDAPPARAVISTPDAQAAWALQAEAVAGGGAGTARLEHPEGCAPP